MLHSCMKSELSIKNKCLEINTIGGKGVGGLLTHFHQLSMLQMFNYNVLITCSSLHNVGTRTCEPTSSGVQQIRAEM